MNEKTEHSVLIILFLFTGHNISYILKTLHFLFHSSNNTKRREYRSTLLSYNILH